MRRLRVADIAVDVADGLVDVAVDGHQIEPAVEIDIEEGAAESEAVCATPGRRRLRSATSAYAPARVGPVERHHLVVEIGDGDAGARRSCRNRPRRRPCRRAPCHRR